jgi:hypothetical protein
MTMGRAVGGAAEKVRTLAAAQGVDDIDGHALAGFIEAEGSFSIAANNRGRSWLCAMSLNQRADDADVLCDIVRVTGLGRLYGVPARRTSRPQVVWSVASKLECRELARLLQRYPLRGRERREFAVWSAAVERWSESLHGSTATADGVMRCAAAELRALRRYVDPVHPGGADGDALWRAELREAIAVLDGAMLRGRKRRDFEAWRVGAAEYARGRDRDEAVIAAAAASLARARAYVERPLELPAREPPTEAYIDVLRAFAGEVPGGRLTCTAYTHARARHPEWPTRNTLAMAFGSWERALAAAGLGARASPWRRDCA